MKKEKVLKGIGVVIISIIVLLLLIVMGFNIYQHIKFSKFYRASEKAMLIPDINSGVTPQGLEYNKQDDTYYMCGYMKDGSASRFYSFNDDTKAFKMAQMKTADGKMDASHSGGMAVWNDFVYLSTGKNVNIYRYSLLKEALEKGETIAPFDTLETPLGPAFCYVKNNYLYVGEFYIAEKYETPKNHHIKTDAGDNHKAIMTVYKLSKKSPNGIATEIPVAVYSIIDQAQGVCITDDGNICISTSWSLQPSHIAVFEDPAHGVYRSIDDENLEADSTYEVQVGDKLYNVPLYYLDSNHLKKDWVAPPMTEGIVYKNGRIYILYESASNKYLFGKLSGGTYIYSLPQE